MKKKIPFVLLTFIVLNACTGKSGNVQNPNGGGNESLTETTLIPESWIKNRVDKAKNRLLQTEAGTVVWKAMEAHGGLETWYANGYLSFHFNYQPLDGGTPRNTYQIVDTWSNKARHKEALDTTLQYGWNGKVSWVVARDSSSIPYNTRFWALTPYYFIGIPFVLDGAGVNLELLPQTSYKEKSYEVVKVTFDAGTGDAPDDYYVLYFSSDTHKLGVIRYIVSYPGYFEKGKHMPEKFMDIFGEQTVDGILLPKRYNTHWLAENNLPGELITEIELTEVSFTKEIKDNYFDAPKDAKINEGL